MVRTNRSGYDLLTDPILNKGTAFTQEERDLFALNGLLPPHVTTLDKQVERRLEAFRDIHNDLGRYAFLRDLQDSNETLFYALLSLHIEEMLPIVYTPVVGLGCQRFSHIYRKPRGLFLSPPHKNRIAEILGHPRYDNVRFIVVTDGERILGLGDQGAGGMGISIGKLSLYSACGGIDPAETLPIMLDVGTNNQELLSDPIYIGWRHERVRGQEYDDFIEAFVTAVAGRWDHVLLQWEDFAGTNASRLLDRYRDRLCTFNDDVQGTAAIVCGTVLAALSSAGLALREQRIVVVGAGSAGCGISELLVKAMVDAGDQEEAARRRFFMVDRNGLLTDDTPDLLPFQRRFMQPADQIAHWDLGGRNQIQLEDVVRHAKPTIMIGVSGKSGAFTAEAVQEMARHVERPLIFPLSNPTSQSEAKPADLLAWTEGRAVIGTGSPFPPVELDGAKRPIDQVNNSYIFPGLGLGVLAARARRVSDTMFLAAARALAAVSPSRQDPHGTLLPPVTSLRATAIEVARAVALQAAMEGLAPDFDPAKVDEAIRRCVWEPRYVPYEPDWGDS